MAVGPAVEGAGEGREDEGGSGRGGGSSGKLLRLDPETGRRQEYALRAGRGAGPYALTVDGRGRVWVNELTANTVLLFDPTTEKFEVFELPTANTGIRKMVVDARGRLWYLGSHSGKLGVIQ